MTPRSTETFIAKLTILLLVVYVPLETWTSLPYGLLNPFYLVDVVAMLLMAWGAYYSLRARPKMAPEILCAAYAWSSANGWRATAGRVHKISEGGELDLGMTELWGVAISTSVSITLFVVLLILVIKKNRTG